jgi:hypothetical protein
MGTYARTVFEENKNNVWFNIDLADKEENKGLRVLQQSYDSFSVLADVRNRHGVKENLFKVKGRPKDMSEWSGYDFDDGQDYFGFSWVTLTELRNTHWSHIITLHKDFLYDHLPKPISINVRGIDVEVVQLPLQEFACSLYDTYLSMESYAKESELSSDNLRMVFAFY